MTTRELRLAAVVLAAGAGSRFSRDAAAKLVAPLDGRPVLQRVLDAVRAMELASTLVVLGDGAAQIEQSIVWGAERRVRNPAPERGISSSLQLGIGTLTADSESYDGAFVVLGDQPLLRTDVMAALAAAAASARPADRPVVVPIYEDEPGPRNPALLLRPAWGWVEELSGDRGLGGLIAGRPDMVQEVHVAGAMPDVDRPEDLRSLSRGAS